MYCSNCGTELKNGALECSNCGMVMEAETNTVQTDESRKVDYSAEFEKLKSIATESAEKAVVGAKQFANQAVQKLEEKRAEMKAQAEQKAAEEAARQQELQKQEKERNTLFARGTNFMSSTELWSWLKQSTKRQLYYTEEPSTLTESEFVEKIVHKMEENNVPATIEQRSIQWDRSRVHKDTFFIKPFTDVVNPLTCLVQFNHVGKFTFVEEKTFITPPDLPPVPEKPWTEDLKAKALAASLNLYAIIALIAGLLMGFVVHAEGAIVVFLVAVVLFFVAQNFKNKNDAVNEHNQKCAEQERAWANAWSNWQNSIFVHSFQEDINGQLSRIYDSVFECIKQVSAEEFAASKVVEQEESSKINELEELIARRKEEYR